MSCFAYNADMIKRRWFIHVLFQQITILRYLGYGCHYNIT